MSQEMVAQEAMPETQAIPEIPETMVSVVTVVQQAIPETPATRETPETMVREEIEATVVMQAIQEIPATPEVLVAPVEVGVVAEYSL